MKGRTLDSDWTVIEHRRRPMLSPLGRLGSFVRRGLTLVGSLALKLGPIKRALLLVASIAAVVILCSLLLALMLAQG